MGRIAEKFLNLGASHVTGLDLSEKMLQIAKTEARSEQISFVRMSMSDLSALGGTFDVVFSFLPYIMWRILTSCSPRSTAADRVGIFLFSQEHPFTTALRTGPRWSQDENGTILHYNLSDYSIPGIRTTTWIVDGVIGYHRSFSAIVNALSAAGFRLEQMLEPLPGPELWHHIRPTESVIINRIFY